MSEGSDLKEWMRRAEQDRGAVTALTAISEPFWEIAGFHAQQMAEKYIKGFLLANGWTLKKTHDLSDLLTDCLAYDASLAMISEECRLVTPFAMAGRYPRPGAFSRSTCEAAIAAAERIRAEILKRLPDSHA